jgi:tRNA pseudouridine38-40 synthase
MSKAAGRIALGVAYRGSAYQGWQSQPGGRTVQDRLEDALSAFADTPVVTVCAGRTDTGVHALNQVVHVDAPVAREPFSWVRGTNRYLPSDIAVQWCVPVGEAFHARNRARGRRYIYLLLEAPVRPSLESGLAGWVFRALDGDAMRSAATHLTSRRFAAVSASRRRRSRRCIRSASRAAVRTGASTSTATPSCTTWCAT